MLAWGLVLGLGLPMQLGCASSQSKSQTPAALSAEDARLFECGVDFIAKPEGLAGRWREEYEQDLLGRVQQADLVAQITVRTLRTDTAPDKRVTHRLTARVDRTIHGETAADEIELAVRDNRAGFATVDQAAARMTSQQFVAYLKRAQNEVGETELYFHLSPSSEEVVSQTEAAVLRVNPELKTPGERVIVHSH